MQLGTSMITMTTVLSITRTAAIETCSYDLFTLECLGYIEEFSDTPCICNCKTVTVEFKTDNVLDKPIWTIANNVTAAVVPKQNDITYAPFTEYSEEICLDVGSIYTFAISDFNALNCKGEDCTTSAGSFKVFIEDTPSKRLLFQGGSFDGIFEQRINLKQVAVTQETCRNVTVEVTTKNNPTDTTWKLVNNADEETPLVKNPMDVVKNRLYSEDVCLDIGNSYTFNVSDESQSGLKKYTIFMHDGTAKLVMFSSNITATNTFIVEDRETEWLVAHNTRRKKYHEEHDTTYVPLQWSIDLVASAQVKANSLLGDCSGEPLDTDDHTDNFDYGENMAGNKGIGNWGRGTTPDKYLGRYVEREIDHPRTGPVVWPNNRHMTQALWRATKYVGCANAAMYTIKENGKTQVCTRSVCHYARTGNCGMGNDKVNGVVDFMTKFLADESSCGDPCPENGCF